MSAGNNLVTINIDGEEVQVPAGINIIEAAALMGKEIPHYCYHPKLTVAGNCRMCLMEMGMVMKDRQTGEVLLDENGKPKVGWAPKPAIGCGTNAAPGMYIKTDSPLVKDCQKGVMEFLLVNHPLDCPICDQAGECSLQEFATEYGRGYSRFVEQKNVKPKRVQLGPRVTLDDERCILCSRCVRFCQEIVKDDVLGFIDRGSYSTLTCYPGKQLDSNYSLNTVDICPVGALTSTDFRFKMRVWFLKKTNSICTESSVGVNTIIGSREGKIYRTTPRRNDAVNDTWMSDSGRELYKAVESEDRLQHYWWGEEAISFEEACLRFKEILETEGTAYVGSSLMSVEEQFLFKKVVDKYDGPVCGVYHQRKGDGLLISSDARPNLRGVLLTGLLKELPEQNLSKLLTLIRSGKVHNLVVYHEDIMKLGLTQEDLRKVRIIFIGTHENETSKIASLLLPTLMVFEKAGSFINQQWRLQKFHSAVPGPNGVLPDIDLLHKILMGKERESLDMEKLWEQMREQIPQFKEINGFKGIPDEGIIVENNVFKHFQFCEGKGLHFNPENR